MTPIQASKKPNEREVYNNIGDKSIKRRPKNKIGELLRTSTLREFFYKGDTTNRISDLYTKTNIINHTTLRYNLETM